MQVAMQVTLTKELIDSTTAATEHPALAEFCDSDGCLTVTVWLSGNTALDHYGVFGSPVWVFVDNIKMKKIEINDVLYTTNEFEQVASDEASAYIDELIENIEYELTDWE